MKDTQGGWLGVYAPCWLFEDAGRGLGSAQRYPPMAEELMVPSPNQALLQEANVISHETLLSGGKSAIRSHLLHPLCFVSGCFALRCSSLAGSEPSPLEHDLRLRIPYDCLSSAVSMHKRLLRSDRPCDTTTWSADRYCLLDGRGLRCGNSGLEGHQVAHTEGVGLGLLKIRRYALFSVQKLIRMEPIEIRNWYAE